jgi:hypothetical protein
MGLSPRNCNDTEVGNLTLSFFSTMRIILAFLLLSPCIALQNLQRKVIDEFLGATKLN